MAGRAGMGAVLLAAVLLTGCTTVVQGTASPGQPPARGSAAGPPSPEEQGRVPKRTASRR